MNSTVLESAERTESVVSDDVRLGTDRGAHLFFNITKTPVPAAKADVVAAEAKVAGAAEGAPKEAAEAELKAAEEALEDAEATKIELHVDAKDPVSGNYYQDASSVLEVAAAELEGEDQQIFLPILDPGPHIFRVRVVTVEAQPWTYSVGASPIR